MNLVGLKDQIEALTAMLASAGVTILTDRTSYTVEEVAGLLGREPYTVREWCRLGRINALKAKGERCGPHEPWRITSAEVIRIKNDGLLALEPRRNKQGRAGRQ